jgi:hypothetical protein
MQGLMADGRYAQIGVLLDQVLPDIRRAETSSRQALMMMTRAFARPYAADGPARAEFEDALTVARSADDPIALGYVLSHYGQLLTLDGDMARAQAMHEEMIGIARSAGDGNQGAEAHYDLAIDALSAGDPDPAYAHLAAAARHYQDIDHHDGLTRCLCALGALALARDRPRIAAWLIGATAAGRQDVGLTAWPLVAEAEIRLTERLQTALPPAEFAEQFAAGRAAKIDAALAHGFSALSGTAERETD